METALLYYDYADRTPDKWHCCGQYGWTFTIFIAYPKVKPHFIQHERLYIGKSQGMNHRNSQK